MCSLHGAIAIASPSSCHVTAPSADFPLSLHCISLLQGLAEVVRHRQDDDGRSAAYDDLLAAEDAVKAAKRGIHSAKEAPAHRFADLSVDAGKAKAHFPFLQVRTHLRMYVCVCVTVIHARLLLCCCCSASGMANGPPQYSLSGSIHPPHSPIPHPATRAVYVLYK